MWRCWFEPVLPELVAALTSKVLQKSKKLKKGKTPFQKHVYNYEKLSSRVKSQTDTEINKIIQELSLEKNYIIINVALTTSFLGNIVYRIINDNNIC